MAVHVTKTPYRLWIFRGMLAVITLTAVLSILSFYFPYTAIGKGWPIKSASIGVFVPEGWAFFTKDPREESRLIFLRKDGGWEQLAAYRFSLDTHFGFNRHMRAQNVRFSQLLSGIPSLQLSDCARDESAENCLTRILPLQTIVASPNLAEVCGTIVGLVFLKPVPWEWKRRNPSLEPKMRAAKVKVTCVS